MSIINPTVIGDNVQRPSANAELYNPDQLIAGDAKIVTRNVTLKAGQGILLRGTILGIITLGAAASAVKGGGNTGTGTCVLDAAPVQANAQVGVYTLRCIAAAANGGTFRLVDPRGVVLGDYVITGGAGGSVVFNDRVKGTITDGGVDFIVGDGFDITIAAGSGNAVAAVATALDGSNVPDGILIDTTDTTADAIAGEYQTGEFNGSRLIFDNSFTLAGLTPLLRALNIFVKNSISNANPT